MSLSGDSQYFCVLVEGWEKKEIESSLFSFPKKMGVELDVSHDFLAAAIDVYYPGFFHTRRVYLEKNSVELAFPDGSLRRLLDQPGTNVWEKVDRKEGDLEEAESILSRLSVGVTGARTGETIWGAHPTISGGAMMKIVSGTIPASKTDLDLLRSFPGMWKTFLNKLDVIEFFSPLNLTRRAIWLMENQKKGEFDFGDVGTDDDFEYVHLRVEDVGKGKFLSVEPENLTKILEGPSEDVGESHTGGAWSALEVRDFFPRKPGSKARHNTLTFWPRFWKIHSGFEKVEKFKGPVYVFGQGFVDGKKYSGGGITLFTGLAEKYEPKNKSGYEVVSKKSIGIVLSSGGAVPGVVPKSKVFEVLAQRYQVKKEVVAEVAAAYFNFTPGAFKSLIQKLIRYSPLKVYSSSGVVDSRSRWGVELATAVCFVELLYSPGSFVPDIQRFVGGQESAFKRLMVSVLEDSYFHDDVVLEMVAVSALVSQRLSMWRPTMEIIERCLDVCDFAVATRKYWVYDFANNGSPFSISASTGDRGHAKNVSAILDELRSFETDLAMTRNIARFGRVKKGSAERPETMDIAHAFDMHFVPEVSYLFPYAMVQKYAVKGTKPYTGIFGKIWDVSSSLNPRKGLERPGKEAQKIRKAVVEAQTLLLKIKQTPYGLYVGDSPSIEGDVDESPEAGEAPYKLRTQIPKSWIAGMIGPIDVPPAMVTLKPEDPNVMVAVKKPSRGLKDGTLTDQQSEAAIAKATKILEKGILLGQNGSTPPLQSMKGLKVRLVDGEFIFVDPSGSPSGSPSGWEKVSKVRENIPYLEDYPEEDSFDLCWALQDGIKIGASARLGLKLRDYPIAVTRRLSTYLGLNKPTLELSRISKDGGGTASAVTVEDVGVCQLLLAIASLFPRALQRVEFNLAKFRVVYVPLFWKIREFVAAQLSVMEKAEVPRSLSFPAGEWQPLEDKSGRIPRDYQKDCLQEMIDRQASGQKGSFLWLVVGLGKTMIVMMYCQYLISQNLVPPYIIYTLPKSALESILTEIEFFGGKINLLNPTQSWKKHPKASYSKSPTKPLPGHFNIIEHDHLRHPAVEEELVSIAGESLLIVDEVHKTLNTTKRTGVALELSRLAKYFVVLTGTPVIDSNTFKLTQWLEQIVDFEINDKNFWVGALGMISKTVNTGVEVRREENEVQMTEEENRKYRRMVPPGLGGKNTNPSAKDINEAFEICYEVCDRVIISSVVKNIKHGVFVVARNSKHQNHLKDLLVSGGVKPREIFLITGKDTIFLTDETVKKGVTPDYRVVITTLALSAGYTLTRLKKMVTGVYPTNLATITQLEGRINRVSQASKWIEIITVHTGILTYTLQKHKTAASISAVLTAMAKDVEVDLVADQAGFSRDEKVGK